MHDDFTLLVRSEHGERFRIDDARFSVESREAESLFARLVRRIHVRLRNGFRHAIRFHVFDTA